MINHVKWLFGCICDWILFTNVNPLINLGYKNKLEQNSAVFLLPEEYYAEQLSENFKKLFNANLSKSLQNKNYLSFILFKMFWKFLLMQILIGILEIILKYTFYKCILI